MKKVLSLIIIFFPWRLRRFLLIKIWNYEIHPSAKIGLSYIYPGKLTMDENSYIGSLNVAIHLDSIFMGKNAIISRSNWITGFKTNSNSQHFKHQKGERRSELRLGNDSAITKHHHIDCTNLVEIGNYVTIAGYYSQILTHSINIEKNIQDSKQVIIGDYTFVGTNSVILGGAQLPPYSILGAKSLLNKKYSQQYTLYGGNPAKPIKAISSEAKYFKRTEGFVY